MYALLLWITTAAARAEEPSCGAPATLADLWSTHELAMKAYAELAPLDEIAARADRELRCAADPLDCRTAAAWFRIQAIARSLVEDYGRAYAYIRAARMVDPGYGLEGAPLPAGHPLLEAYQGAVSERELYQTFALPRPASGSLWVDCGPSASAPSHRPWILQRLDDDGKVVATSLQSGGVVPDYPRWVEPAPEPAAEPALAAQVPPAPRAGSHPAPVLRTAGVFLGVAAGAAGGTALGLRVHYRNAPADQPLARMVDANRTLATTSLVLGGGAALSGLASLVRGEWRRAEPEADVD